MFLGQSQWPHSLRCRSTATRLLRSWIRIPPGAWMVICCDCCMLSGRGLCDGLITRPEESYRMWRVVVCDQETSKTRKLKPATGLWKIQSRWIVTPGKQTNKHYNLVGPPSYMRSVVDRNVVMRHTPVVYSNDARLLQTTLCYRRI